MRMSPEERTKQLTEELTLTDSQAVQVLAVFKTADEEKNRPEPGRRER
jgi:hypothetical protein